MSHLELVYQNEDVDLIGEAGDRGHDVQELLRGAQLLEGPAVALEGSQLILLGSNLQAKQGKGLCMRVLRLQLKATAEGLIWPCSLQRFCQPVCRRKQRCKISPRQLLVQENWLCL